MHNTAPFGRKLRHLPKANPGLHMNLLILLFLFPFSLFFFFFPLDTHSLAISLSTVDRLSSLLDRSQHGIVGHRRFGDNVCGLGFQVDVEGLDTCGGGEKVSEAVQCTCLLFCLTIFWKEGG